jgi:arabinosaccharide transport system substrate-binding protein
MVTAVISVVLRVVTAGHGHKRPDLILVTHAEPHYDAYLKLIPEFERQHGVEVQLQLANWASLQSRLQNAFLAGVDTPDVAELFEGSLGFFTRGRVDDFAVLDLTERLRAEGLFERLAESRYSLWSARGRIYGLPRDVHPVMLAYRRDIVESLGIDVRTLDTWEKFVAIGRSITRDLNGDGVIDRYMMDLRYDGSWALNTLMLQREGQFFDSDGNAAFATEDVVDLIHWYLLQTRGPNKIAYDAGWGQVAAKALSDGLVLFVFTPDWRSGMLEHEAPSLKGKMALMPLPAWKPGGRRTSVWGGTGIVIMKGCAHPDLAWELIKFLYFRTEGVDKIFAETNVLPSLKQAWTLPELEAPDAYYSDQRIGRMYAALASQTPSINSSPVDPYARLKLAEAYSRSAVYYDSHGENGLGDFIRRALADGAADVQRMAGRDHRLEAARDWRATAND